MDTNKKFLYVNPAASNEDAARMFPVSQLLSMHMINTDSLQLTFEDAGTFDHTLVDITITDGQGKEMMKEIAEQNNFSKEAVIILADNSNDTSHLSQVDFGTAPAITEGAVGIFNVGAALKAATTITATAGDFIATSGTLDVKDGGAVTQGTNRTTGVTLNKLAGKVTGNAASLAAVTIAAHTVTNSTVGANDVVIVSKVSGDADTSVYVDAVSAGSFNVAVRNNHASDADTTALVYNFVVIKGSNS